MSIVPKEVIIDVVDFLKRKKTENSSESYISIKNALKLFSIPVPIVTLPAGTKLFRIRVHDKPNILYSRIQDLGHRLDRNGITKFGRANEPLQSIFYCSDVRETAFCETSKLVRKNPKGAVEENTVGIWKLNKDITVATLPKDKDHGGNPIVSSLNKDFDEFVKANASDSLIDLQYFLNRVADEFSAEESSVGFNYLITAAFANYVYETPMGSFESKKKVNIDGVIYPSVHWKSQGMNFALKAELIENRDIELESAIYNKMELITEDTYAETINIISKRIEYDSFRIVWNEE